MYYTGATNSYDYPTEDDQQIIYFYDLPKDYDTSVKINEILTQKGIKRMGYPQVRRDYDLKFFRATARFGFGRADVQEFKEVAEKIKYFKIDGKPCRALPFQFDQDLFDKGTNLDLTYKNNIIVKGLDLNIQSAELDEMFKEFGKVKSAKVSLNPDYTSKGYGFVYFQSEESAERAIKAQRVGDQQVKILPYPPTKISQLRKAANNHLYAKNFPIDWTEKEVIEFFSIYGNIKRCIVDKKSLPGGKESPFAFVLFENSSNVNDMEYGPRAAIRAAAELHNNDQIIPGHILYVEDAFKKFKKEMEKKYQQPMSLEQLNIQMQQQSYNLSFQNSWGSLLPSQYNQKQVEQNTPAQQLMILLKVNQNLPPYILDYNQQGFQLVPQVVPNNPNYKGQVGEFIYELVEKIAGEDKAPKITGMLIDLPIEEIRGYLKDFMKFQAKVHEANSLLENS